MSIILDVKGVSQYFGDNNVLYDVNIQVMRGEFVGIVGHSGCGKSTLLKAIQGTQPAKEGVVLLDNEEVHKPSRNIGMVYQAYNLYDFLTAQENVAFGLCLDQSCLVGNPFRSRMLRPLWWRKTRKQHMQQAEEILVRLGLESAIKCYPCELSGGMRQRVAIAQALIMKPKILLMDEPFGALDESTREELQKLLLILYQENIAAMRKGDEPLHTVILITHELNEAFYCCDRVIGLSKKWSEKTSDGLIRGKDLGATKVYDKAAPVYAPNDPKNFDLFAELMKDLRQSVINNKNEDQDRNEHVTFWEDLAMGVGTGVAIEHEME